MVNWFEKKSSSASSDLSSPLLPHGTDDNRTTSQKQRDINMAFATQAVATQSPPNNNNGRGGGRESSTGGRRGSTGRRSAYRDSRSSRKHRLHQIQRER